MSDLVANVDMIVHNAWKVNFNQALVSYEDHIRELVVSLTGASKVLSSLELCLFPLCHLLRIG